MKKNIFTSIAIAIICLVINNATMAQTAFPVTVNPTPTVFVVGSSAASYCTGSNVTVTLSGSEVPANNINYELFKNASATGIINPGSGALLPYGGQTFGTYTIVATNSLTGCDINMTGSVAITEDALPNFTGNPANSIICEAASTQFVVTVNGAAAYQWQVSTDAGLTWNNIINGLPYGGATTTTLTITGATTAMTTYQYRCLATSPMTCQSNSLPATLTVNAAPVITVQPTVLPTCDQTANVSIPITDNAATHQWQVSINGGGAWSNIVNGAQYTGGTTAALNIVLATTAMTTYKYRCISTSATGCVTTSAAATLTVNSLPSQYVVSSSATRYCAGTAGVAINLSASTTGTNYDLLLNGTTTASIQGGTTPNALSWAGQPAGTYTVVATTVLTGCTRTMTGAPVVTMDPLPTAGLCSWSTLCQDQNVTLSITGLTGTGPWTIKIYDQVLGAPGSVIHTENNVTNANPTIVFSPNWTGTQTKYIYMSDQFCGAWK